MAAKRFQSFTKSALPALLRRYRPDMDCEEFMAASHVFPMRINNHIAEDLIDWPQAPIDSLFQLSIPQPGMLHPYQLLAVMQEMRRPGSNRVSLRAVAESVRRDMNPHPAGQKEENKPLLGGKQVHGLQHKYRETVLFFPSEAQYCHAYCTYCFRWAQFTSVGSDQAFRTTDRDMLLRYISQQPAVTDVLFTGGDPMVMPARLLRHYLEPFIGAQAPMHLATIRLGTKSLAWWPYRFVSDSDAGELLQLFSDVVRSGMHLTIQAHFSHPREVEHPVTQEAIRLIRMTGAQIRSQAPLIRHVNDNAYLWLSMWKLQTRLGVVPYYMFVERDTGAFQYFSVPLATALKIFSEAYSHLPGPARTVRGPSMSAGPGKVCVLGTISVRDEVCFVLRFIQGRNPEWSRRIFLAKFDAGARWLDDLQPAFGQKDFFFTHQHEEQKLRTTGRSSGQLTDVDWQMLSTCSAEQDQGC